MRKKFISALLFGALVAASTSTFVSCKDYDDDINGLQGQITTNASTLEELVNEKVSNLTTEINALKSQDATLQEALTQAQADLAAAKTYTDQQAAAAQAAAIEAARQEIAAAQATLQAGIDDANTKLAALDGQVATQEQQIAALLDADNALQTAINTANGEIETAKNMATTAQQAAEAAQNTANQNAEQLAQLVTNLTTVKEELDGQISVLGEKVDGVIETVAANKAEVDGKLAEVNALIAANTTSIEALKDTDTELAEKITKNTNDLLALQEQLTKMQAACEANLTAAKAYTDTEVAALKSALGADIEEVKGELAAAVIRITTAEKTISSINEALKNQETTNAGVSESIKKLEEDLATAQEAIESNMTTLTARIGVIAGQIEDINGTLKLHDTRIETVQSQADALRTDLDALQGTVDEAKENLAKLTQDFNNYVSSNDAALAKLKTDLTDAYTQAINNQGETLRGEINEVNTELQSKIDALDGKLTGEGGINDQLDAIRTQIGAITGDDGTVGLIDEKINAANSRIDNVEQTIATLRSDIESQLADVTNEIGIIWTQLAINHQKMTNTLTALDSELARLAGLSKQLKSLVFCPTTYVDGIECIKFATLKYTDWGTSEADWKADAAKAGNANYSIDNKELEVEYFANPRGVLKSDIEELAFVSNNATNDITRAVNPEAPISVVEDGWDFVTNENGAYVLKLKLQKNGTESLGDGKENFTIVALKATLDDKYLTDEEKANGEKAEVYSDWARVYETSVTPRIHNELAIDKSGKLESDEDAHFWSYSEVYNNSDDKTQLPTEFNTKHIAIEKYYEEELDLLDLVMVCAKEDHVQYLEEEYGLDYQFNIMDYTLENEGQTHDATNQKYFGKLLEDGHTLVSTARNGEERNRDAIGRQPMIQVVLKDVRDPENPKVVDVRYFKVKWVDKTAIEEYPEDLKDFTDDYVCGNEINNIIGEEELNALYAWKNLSRDEFHNSYTLDTKLYATLEDAKKAQNSTPALGSIKDLADDEGHGQTHNLQWTINTTANEATQEDYERGYMERDAYGVYQSTTNANSRIIFHVTLRLNIAKMALADGLGHDQTMWSSNGERNINPQLETDATYGNASHGGYETTMILGSLLKGYINDGKTPASVDELVNFGDDVQFVIDGDRLDEVAAATGTNVLDWTLSADGKHLSYNGVEAAFIASNDRVQLWESRLEKPNTGSVPSEGAKLLVGKCVPVKLVDEWCNLTEVFEEHNVRFLTPLAFNNPTVPVTLKDITAGGSSSTSFSKTIKITEAFTTNKRTVYVNGGTSNEELMKWYGVPETPTYAIGEAKTNIQKDGSIGTACNVLLSDIQNSDGTPKYIVSVDATESKVTFSNMSGNAIGQSFKIEIPVVMETKWQTLTAKIVVTVEPAI